MESIYDIEICDCHHHLWDLQENYYPWLTDTKRSRVCGDYEPIRHKNFLLADFFENRGELKVNRFVHEEAVMHPSDPVRETRWLQKIADHGLSEGMPHGIVAFADFNRDDIERVLEAHCVFDNTRGIRQPLHEAYIDPYRPEPSPLQSPSWRKNVGHCGKHNLVFDLQIYWQQSEDAIKLVGLHPNMQFVLTHAGLPAHQSDPEYMTSWHRAMKRLSEMPNLSVKLSGFGMFDRDWTVESIRPIVTETISLFGIDRCMFASNFPVDSLSGKSYTRYWEEFFEVVKSFSEDEKRKLFSGNARRIYRV